MKYIINFEKHNIKSDQDKLVEIFDAIKIYDIDKFKLLIDDIDINLVLDNRDKRYKNYSQDDESSVIHYICAAATQYDLEYIKEKLPKKLTVPTIKKICMEMFDIALKKKCNLNTSCGKGWSNGYPIELLSRCSGPKVYNTQYFRDIFLLLIKNGADVNLGFSTPPLLNTMGFLNYETSKLLLENGADPSCCCAFDSCLNHTCWQACFEPLEKGMKFINLLFEYGVDVNIRPIDKFPFSTTTSATWTTLHGLSFQTASNSIPIFNYIVDKGADLSLRNQQGQTCLETASGRVGELITKLEFQEKIIKMKLENVLLIPKKIMRPEIKEKYQWYIESQKYNL